MPLHQVTPESRLQMLRNLEAQVSRFVKGADSYWDDLKAEAVKCEEAVVVERSRIADLHHDVISISEHQKNQEVGLGLLKGKVIGLDKSIDDLQTVKKCAEKNLSSAKSSALGNEYRIEAFQKRLQKTLSDTEKLDEETKSTRLLTDELDEKVRINDEKVDAIASSIKEIKIGHVDIQEQADAIKEECKLLKIESDARDEKIQKNQDGLDDIQIGVQKLDVDIVKCKEVFRFSNKIANTPLDAPLNRPEPQVVKKKTKNTGPLRKRSLWERVKAFFFKAYSRFKSYIFKLWLINLFSKCLKRILGPFKVVFKPFLLLYRFFF